MPKDYFQYTDDFGNNYSFLQDVAIATGVGNVPATGQLPLVARSRHKFRPRKVTVKDTGGLYHQYVCGQQLFAGITPGGPLGALGNVKGIVDEKHFATGQHS